MWQILSDFKAINFNDLAEKYGTPFYIYSADFIRRRLQSYQGEINGRAVQIQYALKANGNLSLLQLINRSGAGFDIVSQGELERALLAGAAPHKVVFSGVAKGDEEMRRALAVGIGCFNVESLAELQRLNELATAMDKVAPIALRINPNVDAKTHPYISTGLKENKFGIARERAVEIYQWAQQQPHLAIRGIGCHIGSQITDLAPFREAALSLRDLAKALKALAIDIEHLDLGGGLGIEMAEGDTVAQPPQLIALLGEIFADSTYEIHLQPGRSIVGNSALLISQVVFVKEQYGRRFIMLDSAMNDYLRPALYQAKPLFRNLSNVAAAPGPVDIVGPVCESGDTFARDYPLAAERGDLIAMAGVGAYGFSMSSNYNSRPRLPELLWDGGKIRLIRRREALASLWADELEFING